MRAGNEEGGCGGIRSHLDPMADRLAPCSMPMPARPLPQMSLLSTWHMVPAPSTWIPPPTRLPWILEGGRDAGRRGDAGRPV